MKLLLLFFISTLSFPTLKAQLLDNATYAKTTEIEDVSGKVIAKMSIIPGLRNEIFLKNCNQKNDSLNFYITEYTFIRPNHLETKNITLILQFNKHFENVYFSTEGEVKNIRTTVAENKAGASFQASSLASDAVISIKVVSKKPTIATITGIAGQL